MPFPREDAGFWKSYFEIVVLGGLACILMFFVLISLLFGRRKNVDEGEDKGRKTPVC